MESVIERTKDIVFDFNTNIPEKYQQEIKKACYLLKNKGCKNVYLFGSMVTGKIHAFSDIDIGIKGLPPEKFIIEYIRIYLTILELN